ncbi:hypothetical protein ANRL4_04212 [Anaerolineae bacterium]|nr:hypothetical protein ANRL4_04212 [Anaerolineae bacterium]
MPHDMNCDTHTRWNSLVALEQAGVFEYPGLAQLAGIPATSIAGRSAVAMKAQQSLIIRLLLRRPLYAYHVCDMQLDRNLRRENGRWTIQFRAKEIGPERVHRRTSAYRTLFPNDLVSQLEEFVTVWRPMLPGADLPELFTTPAGHTFSVLALNNGIRRTTYAHTGRATDARQIRTIWATEFIKKTEDFVAAAEILGDTVESVLRRFAHLRREDPSILADRFFAQTVEDQIESRRHRAQTLG